MSRRRRVLISLAVVAALLAGVVVVCFVHVWRLNAQMMDLDWWQNASAEEGRALSHEVLKWPVGNHHDAFIMLIHLGDHTSVPVLIRALRWQPDGPEIPCTKSHCLEALRRITGHDAGPEYADWRAWWDETGQFIAPNDFPRQDAETG